MPVSASKPEDKYFIEATNNFNGSLIEGMTYELVGPALSKNPYKLQSHELWQHGSEIAELKDLSFEGICQFMMDNVVEGIVFHNKETGQVTKIRRNDFLLVADRYLHWQDTIPEQLISVSKLNKLKV